MIVKEAKKVPFEDNSAYPGVSKQIYIGAKEGSQEIAMRCFSVVPGGSTPYHSHGFPHLVKVEKGTGVVVDKDGTEHPLEAGSVVYVQDDEMHCFKNKGEETFDFICIVPDRGEK